MTKHELTVLYKTKIDFDEIDSYLEAAVKSSRDGSANGLGFHEIFWRFDDEFLRDQALWRVKAVVKKLHGDFCVDVDTVEVINPKKEKINRIRTISYKKAGT